MHIHSKDDFNGPTAVYFKLAAVEFFTAALGPGNQVSVHLQTGKFSVP